MTEWQEKSVAEIAQIIGGGTPKTTKSEYWGGVIPWLSVVDFNNQSRWVFNTEKTITEAGLQNSSTKILKKGQLILSARGTVGALAQLGKDMAFNQSCYGLDAKSESNNDYLYYALLYTVEDIRRNTHGAVFDTITRDTLSHIKIPLPPLPEQQAIAGVLSALDEKIELNRRMNATLEAMARALFKSWFVDFDPVRAKMEGRAPEGLSPDIAALFPDTLAQSPLGEIPNGWEAKALDQIIELIGGGTPKTSVPEYWEGNIPWFSVVDAPTETDVFVIDTEKHISHAGVENSSTKILPEGTTIVSARGTVGRLALVGVPMAMNQSCYGIRGINDDHYWTYFQIKGAVEQLKQRSHGSVFDTITRSTFASLQIPMPPKSLIQAFEDAVSPMLQKIRANLHNSTVLKDSRDTLLPKLISGQLKVA